MYICIYIFYILYLYTHIYIYILHYIFVYMNIHIYILHIVCIPGGTIKLSSEKIKTLQLYFKTFIEKINSGNLIM